MKLSLQVCKGESYTLFIESIKAEETRVRYRQRLRKFLTVVCLDTESLADLGRSNPKKLTEVIIAYILKEKERVRSKEIKPGTLAENIKPVRLFCDMNDILLNWKKLYRLLPGQEEKTEDRAYSKEEIAKLLEFSDIRSTVIVLSMASSGCRVGALPNLKVKHITPVEIDGKVVCGRIVVYANSAEEHVTFVSLECYHAIESYYEYRKRNHEKLNPESPFLHNSVRVYNVKEIERCRPIKNRTIQDIMLRLLYKSGLRVKMDVRRYEVSTDHGFRKFFSTQAKLAGMEPLHKEMLLGHKVGLERSYYRPPESALLKDYIKVMSHLTINDVELVRLENLELKKDRTEIEQLKDKVAEFEELTKHLKEHGILKDFSL